MHLRRAFWLLILAPLPLLAAASPAANSSASAELQAVLDLAVRPAIAPGAKRSETLRADDARAQLLREQGLKFLATHPAGPEHARVVFALAKGPPRFIENFKPGFDEKPSADLVIYDTAAREAWDRELLTLLRGVRDDATAEKSQRLEATEAVLDNTVYEAKTPAEFAQLQREIDAFAEAGATPAQVKSIESGLFYAGASLGVPEFEKLLGAIAQGGNAQSRADATETLATLQRQKANVGKIKFTAADGREVDINSLRGKVVLVDFWATWCGPCVREIPNVRANYEKYHAQGFEIVGITFENAGLARPGGAPETFVQAAEKLAKAKQKMMAFAAERGMTWPQQFDGKYWQNEFGVLFGIHAIPAMFLLDKEGNIVSTNARGENLEPALKRLLAL